MLYISRAALLRREGKRSRLTYCNQMCSALCWGRLGEQTSFVAARFRLKHSQNGRCLLSSLLFLSHPPIPFIIRFSSPCVSNAGCYGLAFSSPRFLPPYPGSKFRVLINPLMSSQRHGHGCASPVPAFPHCRVVWLPCTLEVSREAR